MGQLSFFEEGNIEGSVELTFDGFATKNHSMDLEWYTKSLTGFNESFTKFNKILLNSNFSLEIIAEEEGSITAKLKYVGSIALTTIGLYAAFLSIDSYYEKNPSKYVIQNFIQFIDIFKSSKGNTEKLKELIINSNLSDKEKERLLNLIKNIDFRIALDDLTLFLERQGLDKLHIYGGKKIKTTIEKYERQYFKVQPDDFTEIEEYNENVHVISIGNNQEWKFVGPKNPKGFSAKILDKNFLQNIKAHPAGEIFKMHFQASIIKTVKFKSGNKKPSNPSYKIKSLQTIPEELLFLPL